MKPTIALLLAAVALVGCGTGSTQKAQGTPSSGVVQQNGSAPKSPSTSDRQNVQVVKSGFTQTPPDSINNSYAYWAALISNPNPQDWFAAVNVTATLTDDSGKVLASGNESLNVLPSQSVAAVGSQQVAGATKLQVQAFVTTWTKLAKTPGAFTTEGVNYSPPPQYSTYGKITGSISSSFAQDLQNVRVAVIDYDANGNVVGGDSTFVQVVPAGGKTSFQIDTTGIKPAKVEAYGEVTNLSLLAPTP